jgi:hypothetical protein
MTLLMFLCDLFPVHVSGCLNPMSSLLRHRERGWMWVVFGCIMFIHYNETALDLCWRHALVNTISGFLMVCWDQYSSQVVGGGNGKVVEMSVQPVDIVKTADAKMDRGLPSPGGRV